ncbi:Retrovirus-related Pol polyprotein from type-1 retrotransposable element R1 4-like Protein [Tribolium castaneum]|uniref:Retrovirus-related Pol polyprotein from type-1 retrotransposable element R1 4-like Protein n=1 Tax=Tribolium castaneum TaxID=7070 RepID=A0A139W8I8_TRICA|nr:Retrovirus-related Pol polyprotein from type-1 retrotransposable element R1 4-like Protein [Tribolium castaneum]
MCWQIEKSDFDTYKHAREYVAILVEDLWQERWDSSTKGRTTYRFRPIVQSGLRYSHSFAATQILTGHGNFMSHLQMVGKSETDECAECGVRDDPIHRLLVCPLFDVPRHDIYRSVNSPFLSLNWIIHLKSELLEPFTALPDIRIFGSRIALVKTQKYLGILLDSKLQFESHASYSAKKIWQITMGLRSLAARNDCPHSDVR